MFIRTFNDYNSVSLLYTYLYIQQFKGKLSYNLCKILLDQFYLYPEYYTFIYTLQTMNHIKENENIITIQNPKSFFYSNRKHNVPLNSAWNNKVYFYNKTFYNNMSVLNTSAMEIIRKYFNMLVPSKFKSTFKLRGRTKWINFDSARSNKLLRRILKRIYYKNDMITLYSKKDNQKWLYNRLKKKVYSTNKVWVSKPLVKYGNLINTVTVYVYNRELTKLHKRLKNRNIKTMFNDNDMLLHYCEAHLNRIIPSGKKNKYVYKNVQVNPLTLDNQKEVEIRQIDSDKFKFIYSLKSSLREISLAILLEASRFIKTYKTKKAFLLSNSMETFSPETNFVSKYLPMLEKAIMYKCIKKILLFEKISLLRNKFMLRHKFKFNSVYIAKLKEILEKIYLGKKVNINVIMINKMQYNSDIFTQMLVSKLSKKRKRVKLKKVVNRFLNYIKSPFNRKLQYKREIPTINTIKSIKINSLINSKYFYILPIRLIENTKDLFNNKRVMNNNFSLHDNLELARISEDKLNLVINSFFALGYKNGKGLVSTRNIKNNVLDNIKYKTVTGVKIKASGRLTKRIVAARSIVKVTNKGTIKDINTIYNGMSTPLVRGIVPAHQQFTKLSGNNIIGSYGLKGWVASV